MFSPGWNLTKEEEMTLDPVNGFIRSICEQTDMMGRKRFS